MTGSSAAEPRLSSQCGVTQVGRVLVSSCAQSQLAWGSSVRPWPGECAVASANQPLSSRTGEAAPSATEQPAPGQGCQVVDDLQSSPSEQISGKIQNRSSLDGSFLQPSPVCSSGHCQCLWESISNPFFKHSSQGDSLLEFPSVSCVLLVASPLISQQLDGMGRERENLDMEGQNV